MIRNVTRWWTQETDGLAAAAFIIGAASIASRVVGVIRDRVLAATFGAGPELDAYYAAFRLPDALYTLLVFGTLSAGFIPVFAETFEKGGKEKALALASQMLSICVAALAIGSVGLMVAAPAAMPVIAPGFVGAQRELTIELTRILAWSPFFLGISAVLGGVLQSMRRFLAFSVAPVFYNAGIIFGAVLLAPMFGMAGVAYGVVIGAMLHGLVQWSVVRSLGLPRLTWPTFAPSGVRKILSLMGPRTLSLGVSQFNVFVVTSFASHLESGALSAFSFANNLFGVPVGLIGVSFAIAAFPALARAYGAGKEEEFGTVLLGAARKMAFFLVPATALYVLLRAQIVRLVLGAGAFGWSDTIRTADVLGILSFSMLTQSLVLLYVRATFARQDTWTPLWISLGAAAANIGFAWWLVEPFGVAGLAGAVAGSSLLEALAHWAHLRMKRGGLPGTALVLAGGRIFLATLALSVVGYGVRQALGTAFDLRQYWQLFLQFMAVTVCGGGAYVGVSLLLKSQEAAELLSAIRGRLWRGTKVSESVEEASHTT